MFATALIGGELAPLPQANNLGAIGAVVDAVAEGLDTTGDIAEAIGMAERQGSYYPNAAATLGYVTQQYGSSPTVWRLTDRGLNLVGMDSTQRAQDLARAIGAYSQVELYRSEGADALETAYLLDGLADSTARRRVSTIATWSDWAEAAEAGQTTGEIQAASAATRQRAPQILADRLARERAAQPPAPQMCARCFIQLAASGSCSFC